MNEQKGEKVLIIGAGPSGTDLALHLSKVAQSVTLSRKAKPNETEEMRRKHQNALPSIIQVKSVVKRFTNEGAEFLDGTLQSFTTIIYATGEIQTVTILI